MPEPLFTSVRVCGRVVHFLSRGIYLSTMRFDSSYSTISNNIVMSCSRLTKTNIELSKSLQEKNTTEGRARRLRLC